MDVEKIIFNIYKDEIIISKKFKDEIIGKFKVNRRKAHDIFVKIINYQIKKYGRKLENSVITPTKEESEKMQAAARARRNMKKNKYWESTQAYKKTDNI